MWRSEVQVSEEFAEMIDQMIKVSLSDRYQSAIQVLNALDSCQLRNKLRQYMVNKYAINNNTVADQTFSNLPPAVQWALKMSAPEEIR
jgi:ATP-dependent Zn protease